MNNPETRSESELQIANINDIAPVFPQYQFHYLMAADKMGVSYKVTQTNLDREATLKIMPKRLGRAGAFQQAFTAQAQSSAKLSHLNLVKIYDFGLTHELFFLLEEHVPGVDLSAAANGCRVEPLQTLKVMIDLCHAISHAHEHGVIHGDLQPRTISVTPEIEPKIGDFGLAMALRSLGHGKMAPLNPHYAAPEIYFGLTAGDPLTDIYSLGAIFYNLLTSLPVEADCPTASSIASCDHRFDAIILKALNHDRSHRYQSVLEMLTDISTLKTELSEPAPVGLAKIAPNKVITPASKSAPKFNFPQVG